MGASGRPRTVSIFARQESGEARTVMVALAGPIERGDIPALCRRAVTLLEARPAELVVCDVHGLADADAVTVDALARLQLVARAAGGRLQLAHASAELRDLIRLMGLDEVLPSADRLGGTPALESCEGSALEAGGQSE